MLRAQKVAHRYVAKAIQQHMQDQKYWEGKEATEALFLAAYKVFY